MRNSIFTAEGCSTQVDGIDACQQFKIKIEYGFILMRHNTSIIKECIHVSPMTQSCLYRCLDGHFVCDISIERNSIAATGWDLLAVSSAFSFSASTITTF